MGDATEPNMQQSLVNDPNSSSNNNTESESMPTSPSGVREWFMQNPCERWPFVAFLLASCIGVITLAMFFIPGSSTGAFITAGVVCLLMSGFGAYHFRILLALKEQVDKYSRLNREFKKENAELRGEVDKLGMAREQLGGVESRLKESNKRMKANLEKFQQLDKNLKQLAGDNIAGLEKLQAQSKAVMARWEDSLIKHEKAILNKVFDQFEFNDDKEDMSKEEFDAFIHALPQNYQDRFYGMGKTFEQFAGDDNTMQYEEFQTLVDSWANDEASNK